MSGINSSLKNIRKLSTGRLRFFEVNTPSYYFGPLIFNSKMKRHILTRTSVFNLNFTLVNQPICTLKVGG